MKKTLFILTLLTTAILSQQLRVDSVVVDSVWNSDSSWYDGQGILQQRHSRDCYVGFKPTGQGMAQCFIALSIDSGRTWAPNPNPLIVLDNGIATPIQCGTKGRVKLRVLGGDRENVVFRITGRQHKPVISGNPKRVTMGITGALTPGNPCGVTLSLRLNNVSSGLGFAPISKVYWDGFGNSVWDDSTSTLNWVWQTTVPHGDVGQRRAVIVQARDINGLWSVPETLTVQFGLQQPLNMVSITGGTFQMGDADYATPIHTVTVSDFKIGATEVTQELYTAVMGTNPSNFGGDTSTLRPVERVSWYDAAMFCNALSKLVGKDTVYSYAGSSMGSGVVVNFASNGYRLPTEAEWEYAYRAGTTTNYYWSNTWDTTTANRYCWNHYNSNSRTQAVETKLPNACGLYDMAGNVWEWCNDRYGSYTADAKTDPAGPTTGSYRVLRGGSWFNYSYDFFFRAGFRNFLSPDSRNYNYGFRVACR